MTDGGYCSAAIASTAHVVAISPTTSAATNTSSSNFITIRSLPDPATQIVANDRKYSAIIAGPGLGGNFDEECARTAITKIQDRLK